MSLFLAALLLQDAGIAAGYPGDEGLERDPRVLFVEDFETGGVEEAGARWGDVAHPGNMDFSEAVRDGAPGRRALHIATNGHLYTHVKDVDRLHARFYVRFHPKTGYLHHFVGLSAQRLPAPAPAGTAGLLPPGDVRFSSGIEPWGDWGKLPAPGGWHFYSYWHQMKGSPGKYWGNHFDPPAPELIEPGRWYCIEAMLKANTPDRDDGEQAFWVDGRLAASFRNIRWRTSPELRLNTFWLQYYNTDQPARHNRDTATDRVYEVWFDDVVLATDYIGPVQGKPKSGAKAAVPGRSSLHADAPPPDPAAAPVFARTFDSDAAPFKGERAEGALVLAPKGAGAWKAWSLPAGPATELRFRLKPLGDVGEFTVQLWSDRLKDNVRYRIRGLEKGKWRAVALPVARLRAGWAYDGGAFEGSTFDNATFFFQGSEETRVLLDDLEIRNGKDPK